MGLLAKDLLKTSDILTAGPDDSLASALAQMHSSHDAVFVKDREKLLGVVSLYHALYRTSHPGTTKVKNCLFSPPKLMPEAPVDEIARLMLQSKIYFLPVVTAQNQWLGVVSYRRLLRLNKNLDLKAKPKPLVTIKEGVNLSQAKSLMKLSGVSRLVVVSDSGRLSGIMTRYDLNTALGRLRGEKNRLLAQPVKTFIKRNVVTANHSTPANQLVDTMLEKRIGSIILVDSQFRPTGLVSVRDCLEALAKPKTLSTTVTLQLPKNFRFGQSLMDLVNRWRTNLRRWPLARFDLKLNSHSNAANLPSGYKVLVAAKTGRQKEVVAHGTARDWKLALRKSLERLTSQLKKQ